MVYLGGKTKIAKHIIPVLQNIIDQEDIQLYWEPFCGGANIISKIRCPIKVGTDISEPLIALWKELQEGWQPPNTITEEHYNYVKSHQNEFPSHYLGLVGYLCSFGAKYFGGYARDKGKSAYPERLQTVKRQIAREDIQGIYFGCCDYKDIDDVARCLKDVYRREDGLRDKKALIYNDPPYKGKSTYNGVPEFDYDFFYEWCCWMNLRNIVIISEYNMPKEFECIKVIQSFTNFTSKRVNKEEKLFRIKED